MERISPSILLSAVITQSQTVADYISDLEQQNRILVEGLSWLGKESFRLSKENFTIAQTTLTLLSTNDISEIASFDEVVIGVPQNGELKRPEILMRSVTSLSSQSTDGVMSVEDEQKVLLEPTTPIKEEPVTPPKFQPALYPQAPHLSVTTRSEFDASQMSPKTSNSRRTLVIALPNDNSSRVVIDIPRNAAQTSPPLVTSRDGFDAGQLFPKPPRDELQIPSSKSGFSGALSRESQGKGNAKPAVSPRSLSDTNDFFSFMNNKMQSRKQEAERRYEQKVSAALDGLVVEKASSIGTPEPANSLHSWDEIPTTISLPETITQPILSEISKNGVQNTKAVGEDKSELNSVKLTNQDIFATAGFLPNPNRLKPQSNSNKIEAAEVNPSSEINLDEDRKSIDQNPAVVDNVPSTLGHTEQQKDVGEGGDPEEILPEVKHSGQGLSVYETSSVPNTGEQPKDPGQDISENADGSLSSRDPVKQKGARVLEMHMEASAETKPTLLTKVPCQKHLKSASLLGLATDPMVLSVLHTLEESPAQTVASNEADSLDAEFPPGFSSNLVVDKRIAKMLLLDHKDNISKLTKSLDERYQGLCPATLFGYKCLLRADLEGGCTMKSACIEGLPRPCPYRKCAKIHVKKTCAWDIAGKVCPRLSSKDDAVRVGHRRNHVHRSDVDCDVEDWKQRLAIHELVKAHYDGRYR